VGGKARVYDPRVAEVWKLSVLVALKGEAPEALPRTCAFRVDVRFFMSRPRRLQKAILRGPMPHTAKPDLDNMLKATLDAMAPAKLWLDDAQVSAGVVEKWYEDPLNPPGALIQVFAWGEE
jgi:Holliday junction resolvase RusA-like endonuclease